MLRPLLQVVAESPLQSLLLRTTPGFEQEIEEIMFLSWGLIRSNDSARGRVSVPLLADESEAQSAEITCPKTFLGY